MQFKLQKDWLEECSLKSQEIFKQSQLPEQGALSVHQMLYHDCGDKKWTPFSSYMKQTWRCNRQGNSSHFWFLVKNALSLVFLGDQEMQSSPSRITCPANQRILEVLLLELGDPVVFNNTWWCFLYCYLQPHAVFYFGAIEFECRRKRDSPALRKCSYPFQWLQSFCTKKHWKVLHEGVVSFTCSCTFAVWAKFIKIIKLCSVPDL